MMPTPITDHHELLTLNMNEQPIIENILPGVPGVKAQPLFLDPQNGVWVLRVVFAPGTVLPTHYHTGEVHFFTTKGKWNYVEYPDQPQTAGSYLYEPGGSVHTFSVPADNTEDTEGLMVIRGANINFDADGNYLNVLDATSIMQLFGLATQEQKLPPAKYITPGGSDYTA